MNRHTQLLVQCSIFIVFLFILLIGAERFGLAQGSDSDCSQLKDQWERLYTEMKEKVDGFYTVEQTPIEQIIKRPLIDPNEHKTIAAQVSEALQIKDNLLAGQRKELRNIMNNENKIFGELQHCLQMDKSLKRKDAGAMLKKRKALLDKVVLTVAEVKEVEGRETVTPYTEASGQDQYRRSVNNQWPNYQGWWGY
ncbi:MAG: hypothetical protein ACP5VS_08265 [Desulfomonilaceae bacterium]